MSLVLLTAINLSGKWLDPVKHSTGSTSNTYDKEQP